MEDVKRNGSEADVRQPKFLKPRIPSKNMSTSFKPEVEMSGIRRSSLKIQYEEDSLRPERFPRKASFFIGEQDQIRVTLIDSDNEEICPDDIVVPPDGGWGWVIVFAAFMSNVIVDGTIFSFGVVLVSIVESAAGTDNPVSISTVSWVGGSLTGFYLLAGPFVSSLSNKFGFRATAIIGSIVGFLGLGLAWFFCRNGTPNMLALFIFYGVIGGIGFGLIYVPAVITVGFYFEKKRALATGIAICGSGIGTFLFAPLVTLLITMFEWQGAILAQAGIIFCSSIFGALYRPLKPPGGDRKRRRSRSDPSVNVTPLLMRIKKARDLEKWDSVNSFISTDGFKKSNVGVNCDPSGDKSNQMYENTRKSSTHSLSGGLPQLKQKRLSVPNMLGVTFQPSEVPALAEQPITKRNNSVKNRSFAGVQPNLKEIEEEENEPNEDTPLDKSARNEQNRIIDLSASRINIRLQSSTNLEIENLTRKSTVSNITLVLSNPDLEMSQSRVFRVSNKNPLNAKPMHRDDIFYSGSLAKIPEYAKSTTNIDAMCPSVEWQAEPVLTSLEDIPVKDETGKRKCAFNCSILKKMLDFSLLKSLTFMLLSVSGGITMLGFFVPFMYLKAIAMEQSLDDGQATLLISIIGVANTIGRIICGGIADKLSSNVLLINNIALTVGGIATIFVPFLNSYPLFILYSCLFGISIACFASLRSILLVELLGLNKLTNAFGLLLLFQGLAAFVGSPIAGFLKDATGTFAVSFYVAGSLLLLSGVMCYPIHMVNNWELSRIKGNEQKELKRTTPNI